MPSINLNGKVGGGEGKPIPSEVAKELKSAAKDLREAAKLQRKEGTDRERLIKREEQTFRKQTREKETELRKHRQSVNTIEGIKQRYFKEQQRGEQKEGKERERLVNREGKVRERLIKREEQVFRKQTREKETELRKQRQAVNNIEGIKQRYFKEQQQGEQQAFRQRQQGEQQAFRQRQQHLRQLSSRGMLGRIAAWGQSGGPGGASGGGLRGGIGGLAGGLIAASGPVGWAAGAAAGAAGAYFAAPSAMAGMAAGGMSAGKKWMDFRSLAASTAVGGGYDTSGLMNRMGATGAPPAWRERFGFSSADPMNLMKTGGFTTQNEAQVQGLSEAIGGAGQSKYLRDLGNDRLAQSGGMNTLLGGGTSGPAATDYFRKMRQVMEAAQTYGLDHSKVLDTLESLNQQASGAGLRTANMGGFWNQLASSGAPSARTGQMQTSISEGINQTASQYGWGGGVPQNYAVSKLIGRAGGLKAVSTRSGLMKLLGRTNIASSEEPAFQQMLAALQGGDENSAMTHATPFLVNNDANQKFINSLSGEISKGQPGYRASVLRAKYNNISQANEDVMEATRGKKLPAAKADWGDVSTDNLQSIKAASAKYGIPPEVFAGIIQQEDSNWDPTRHTAGPSSATGLGQITKRTFDSLHDQNLINKDYTWEDMKKAGPNVDVMGALLQSNMKGTHGNLDKAIKQYYSGNVEQPPRWPNGVMPPSATQYLSNIRANANSFGPLAQANPTADIEKAKAREDNLKSAASKQAADLTLKALNGAVGDAALTASKKIEENTGRMVDLLAEIAHNMAHNGFFHVENLKRGASIVGQGASIVGHGISSYVRKGLGGVTSMDHWLYDTPAVSH